LTEISTNAVNQFQAASLAGVAEQTLLTRLGPLKRTQNDERRKNMNDQNRVLVRQGARDLNEQEVEQVSGGFRTLTACTLVAVGVFDGECSN